MRHLLFLLAFFCMMHTANAQIGNVLYNPANTTGIKDTVTNTQTVYLQSSPIMSGGNRTIQLNCKRVSGNLSAYAVLMKSIDSKTSPSGWAMVPATITDTFKLAAADSVGIKSKIWDITNAGPGIYAIKIVSTGTMKFTVMGWLSNYLVPTQ